MDNNASRTPSSPSDDDFEEEEEEGYEDDEATIDEEEGLGRADGDIAGDDELLLLSEEGELSIEELRRRYMPREMLDGPLVGGGADVDRVPCSSASEVTPPTAKLSRYFSQTVYQRGPDLHGRTEIVVEEEEEEEEEDEEYMPRELWKKAVRIGPDYQVDSLPEVALFDVSKLCNGSATAASTVSVSQPIATGEAEGMWIFAPDKCSLWTVEQYLADCEKIRADASPQRPPRSNSLHAGQPPIPVSEKEEAPPFDDENALYALLKADYDAEKAKTGAPFPWASLQSVNGAKRTYQEPWRPWGSAECEKFEDALIENGKNFAAIIRSGQLPNRTVGELVRFYYSWKRTERHDIFVERRRRLLQTQPPLPQLEADKSNTEIMSNVMVELLHAEVNRSGGDDDGTTLIEQQHHQHTTTPSAREKWLGVGTKQQEPATAKQLSSE